MAVSDNATRFCKKVENEFDLQQMPESHSKKKY